MRFSAKIEYAAVALVALAARHLSGEVVQVRTIAEEHGIPQRFLVQILVQLKAAGLVISTRGASGGYQLAKPPEEITLADVAEAIEGRDESPCQCSSPLARRLREQWRDAATAFRERLDSSTLADLAHSVRDEAMYYI